MAAACLPDVDAALAQLADDYIAQDYPHAPGKAPLYPHFQPTVVPGWLDKGLKHRHGATARLSNVVLLTPNVEWIREALPNGKLPDRADFKAHGDDLAGRQKVWRRAVDESRCLADEFSELVQRASIDALPLV